MLGEYLHLAHKVWLKYVLPSLQYRSFSRGIVFYWRNVYTSPLRRPICIEALQ